MNTIIAAIDAEIAKLTAARRVLTSIDAGKIKPALAAKPKKKKRNLSPEGRKRIADAVRRRWAKQKAEAKKAAK